MVKEFDWALLKRVRLSKGVSRAGLARAARIHPMTLDKYERGESVPDVVVMARIAKELGLGMLEVCVMMRYVPPGLTVETLNSFLRMCGPETPNAVIADFIKGYVYECKRQRDLGVQQSAGKVQQTVRAAG